MSGLAARERRVFKRRIETELFRHVFSVDCEALKISMRNAEGLACFKFPVSEVLCRRFARCTGCPCCPRKSIQRLGIVSCDTIAVIASENVAILESTEYLEWIRLKMSRISFKDRLTMTQTFPFFPVRTVLLV